MMQSDNGTIRTVAWKELFPWLNILRAFRLSIAFPAILFAAIAILLMATGWGVLARVFGHDSPATEWLEPYAKFPWTTVTSLVPDRPTMPGEIRHLPPQTPAEPTHETAMARTHRQPMEPVFHVWAFLNEPILQGLLSLELRLRGLVCLVCCGLWSVAIWAFFGGAITRIAAVQLASGERVGMAAAMRHAATKWPSYFFAPLLPIFGLLLATIPVFVLGIIMQLGLGTLLAGVVWPLALVMGLIMILLLLGALLGWPLMWATISTEGTDTFDALSRSYAYTFQRPLRYLFYAIVAAMIGGLGWLLVKNFAAGVIWMSYWAASWGAGSEHINSIMGSGKPLGGVSWAGAGLIHFWTGCVKLAAVGYLFSYFWAASSCIYFLLRRDVDATQMDEVFLDADASELTSELPPMKTDEAGAPVVGEDYSKGTTEAGEGGSDTGEADS